MAIDWGDTGAMISGIGSIASAGAVALAAWLARGTFNDWKKKRVTEREEQHAQACLVAAYKVNEAFQYLRAPLILSSEMHLAEEELKEDERWASMHRPA